MTAPLAPAPGLGSVPAVAAEEVVKRYRQGAQPALDRLSLLIQPGEFFGLLGPNGAGKTTTLSLLCGLLRPDSGTVSVLGLTYRDEPMVIRSKIGVVPQELALYDRLSGRENLVYFGRLSGLGGRLLKERVADCLEIAQLSQRAEQPVATYSGGMKRRLNLAIGLLNQPLLLFLDEPTVGIDTQSRHLIHQELQRLHRQGTTLLYTTHYLEEAAELCSRIAILDNGRILQQGPPGDLLGQSDAHTLEELFLQLTGKQLRDS